MRALAALEVGNFRVEACYDRLQGLLEGPVPFVAHAAARSMAGTGHLAYAGAVLGWVVSQEVFQRERLLWILEGFGVGIVGWMEARLDAAGAHQDPQIQIFYALLVATFKPDESLPRLLTLLKVDHVEVQAAAIRALAALGNPEVMEELLAFSGHDEWVLRGQAAKSIGMLGGPQGVPRLLDLLRDPVFEVRRNAAHALIHLGSSGRAALKWVAEDPLADPFARDLALERLQWLPEGAKG